MTTDSSTYTYKSGEQETVTLRRGTADPHGHALLRIKHDDGKTLDCYVNTAWLRDQLDNLDPRPLTPDAITDEMVERGRSAYWGPTYGGSVVGRVRAILAAALTEPPARPEGLTRLIDTIREATYDPEPVATGEALYNAGVRVVTEEQP